MTYVVTENCISCKNTRCVDVCPVDCFHEGQIFLAINPYECIDCGLCAVECPEDAIKSELELSHRDIIFISLNKKFSSKWPVITQPKKSLPESSSMSGKANKLDLLFRYIF